MTFSFQSLFIFCIATIATVCQSQILFNCPKPSEIKSAFVKSHFNVTEFARNQTYYEIAYKDATQPRMCKCITSRKQYNSATRQIFDAFTIECAGKPYHSDLVFNETDSAADGEFVGVWNQQGVPILSRYMLLIHPLPLTQPNYAHIIDCDFLIPSSMLECLFVQMEQKSTIGR